MARRGARALILGALCLSRPGLAQRAPDTAFQALDGYLQSELTRLRVPGAAVAVVRGDSLVHGVVFGRADESGRAITLETPFMIGSASKSMTALAVMQLADAGRVALDSPVTRYLPWFHPMGRSGWDEVTIRHLLNQNGGIPSYAGRREWADPDTSDAALERGTRALAAVRLVHAPGTTFEYANANFALLGEVIQAVTGASYERYIQEHLFQPLGMNRSFTSEVAAEGKGMAVGYRFWFRHPVEAHGMPFIRSNVPAGGLVASAADMARYLSVHLHEGRYSAGPLVSWAAIEELHRPVAKMNDRWSYAMGWLSGTLEGEPVLWHNGLVSDFYAFMALIPRRHEGIVILANVGNMLDMPRLNGAAFGALSHLLTQDPARESPGCAMCPVFPRATSGVVLAILPAALVLLAFQCGWIAWSGLLKRWRSRRGNVIALCLSAVWAAFVLLVLPRMAEMPLSVLSDVMPDLAALIYSSVAISLAWAVVRLGMGGRERSRRSGVLARAGTFPTISQFSI